MSGGERDPVLDRIRALLAKAEATTFEAEAEAFTAKAQELATRHAIDAARLQAEAGPANGDGEQLVAIRVPIDAPYADAKSLLLQTVATAGRCRTVMHQRLGLSTVVGYPADVAATEVLFTSLLVQAQRALNVAARHAAPGARPRRQSFRSAFLLAYAQRIGERLTEINDALYASAEAEGGGAFLPVLRDRASVVDDYIAEQFGTLVSAPVRGGYDSAGWAGGTQAANNAQLSLDLETSRRHARELS